MYVPVKFISTRAWKSTISQALVHTPAWLHSKTIILHILTNTCAESNEFKCTRHEFSTANGKLEMSRERSDKNLRGERRRNSQCGITLHSPTANTEMPPSAAAVAASSIRSSEGPLVIRRAICVQRTQKITDNYIHNESHFILIFEKCLNNEQEETPKSW